MLQGFGVASTQCFKGLGLPRRQHSVNLVILGGLKRVCRVGARREGVGDQHRFLSRVWVSSRVLVKRGGRGRGYLYRPPLMSKLSRGGGEGEGEQPDGDRPDKT